MSFTFRNLFSEEGGDPEVESESGLSRDANPFSGDPEGVRGTQPSGPKGESARGPSLTLLASELLALIPPAISAQSGIPMSKEITVPLPPGGSHEVSLSTIYQLCPELFAAEITPLNDSTVTLPARLGEIGSAGSGRARVSLSDGLAAASSASAFSSEGFLPKGFSPAGAAAGEGAGEGAGTSEPGERATPPTAAPGLTLNWGAGPEAEGASNSPAAPAAGITSAEKNPFSSPTPTPNSSEGGALEKAAEVVDGTGSEDSLFGASPFEGGDFGTLFTKQAEADRDIPFPGGDRPGAPPPGFGEYFLSGKGVASGEKGEGLAGEGSAPSADGEQKQGASPEATAPIEDGERATRTVSNQAATQEPPQGTTLEASPVSAQAPTETQGGDPPARPVEPVPSEGFSPSAGFSLEWPSAGPDEKQGSAEPLDAWAASQHDIESTAAETPSSGPAFAEAPETSAAALGGGAGGMADAISGPAPSPPEPSGPLPPLGEDRFAPPAAGFAAPPSEGFSNREDASASLPPSPRIEASAAPTREGGRLQGFETGSCEESPGGRREQGTAGNQMSSEAFAIAPSQLAAADPGLRDLEFRALFSSDESFTLAKVARRIVEMPGIKVCSLATPGRFVKASTSENESLGDKAKEMSEAIRNLAKLTGLPDARCFTLHSDHGTVSLFVEGDCCLTVNHDETAFGPGVRERLILMARSIHKLEG